MTQYYFNSYEVGEKITFKSGDGYEVHGRICHIRYSRGVRSERIMYQVSGCVGHPKYTTFWVSIRDGKEYSYGA